MAVELNLANAVVKRALDGEGSPRYIEVRLVGRKFGDALRTRSNGIYVTILICNTIEQ
jgi:hypothetical protein